MEKDGRQVVQISIATFFLGVWLIAAPVTFGYVYQTIGYSDWIAGLFLVVFGLLATHKERHWAAVVVCLVGLWLQLAPLFFWAKEPQAYLNDTLVGILAIIFGLFHPRMTGLHRRGGLHIPPGWTYNPSTWSLRIPTIGLATLCWFFARYMAAFQLGYIDHIWDPFFGFGTEQVVTSHVSKLFPIPDAGLGAFVYTLEVLMGWQGDSKRWHTMPWMVLTFGFFVVPAGLVSILLIILQPVAVGAWCSWCLATAACMLIMILFTTSEVVATVQFLLQIRKEGKPFWKTVWHGGVLGEADIGERPHVAHSKRMAWGITIPWNLVLSALCGVWLMFDPYFLGTLHPAADLAYIIGPLMIVFSVVACAEVARAARFLNMLFGVILLIGPWLLFGASALSLTIYMIVGIAVILFSIPKGKVIEKYGTWSRRIF